MSSNTSSSALVPSGVAAAAELDAWLAKYEPVERDILRSRERRLDNAARKRERLRRQFGDLCEASEGLAVRWFREGISAAEMLAYADGDVLTLRALLPFLRQTASERINAVRRRLTRPLYYERENERRRALAAERRRIRKRTTENACPTREEVLDAWLHVRDGRDEMLRFGSILEDLECYVDNRLRFVEGSLVGRGSGIKGWLRENIPALALKYTTVMKYKAAAKKLRQIVELRDPIPLSAVLDTQRNEVRDHSAEKSSPRDDGSREVTILRARAIFLEVFETNAGGEVVAKGAKTGQNVANASVAGCEEVAVCGKCTVTGVMARVDALLDPEKVEEATMLSHWRDRYAREITLRTKHRWRRILSRRVGLKAAKAARRK